MTPSSSSYPRLGKDPEASGLAQIMPWPYLRVSRQGVIRYVNGHFGRMLNRYASEIKGHKVTEFFGSDAGEPPIEHLLVTLDPQNAWHGSWIARVAEQPFSFEIMLRVDPVDPDTLWGIVLENPVINDQVIVSSRSELRLLQTLLDHTVDYLYLMDTSGHFIITNRAFQRAIQVPYPGYEIGKRLGDFVSEETRRQFAVTDKRVLETHDPQINHVSFFRLKNGEGHWVQTTKMPVFDMSRQCIGLACVSRDISQLKETTKKMRQAMRRAEIASQANRDFLANMSHEIRTPINGIIGMTELCLDTRLTEEQQDYLQSVMNCSQTLLKLVNDILDFSKMEGGHLNLEHIDFDLHQCLRDVVSHLKPSARDKSLDLSLEIVKGTLRDVNGDPTRLRQVLYNLINNAIKFTEKGHVHIRAENTGRSFPQQSVRIIVEDTGIGIPQDRQDHIFESFTQADSSTTRRFGGTGLGLAICSKIVNLMEGTIDLKSAPGEGSIFTVELPIPQTGKPEKVEEAKMESANEAPTMPPMHILVVEDNPVNQQVILGRLRKMGHDVDVASNAEEALAFHENTDYDVIFTDVHMPGMDGLELCREIRRREQTYGNERTPVVAMTARALSQDRELCQEAGMDSYIAKPFRAKNVIAVLRNIAHGEKVSGDTSSPLAGNIYSFSQYISKLDTEDREDMLDAGRIYLHSYAEELSALRRALDEERLEMFERMAHRIRGGVGALHDASATELAAELENLVTQGYSPQLRPLLEALAGRMEALAREVQYWIDLNTS